MNGSKDKRRGKKTKEEREWKAMADREKGVCSCFSPRWQMVRNNTRRRESSKASTITGASIGFLFWGRKGLERIISRPPVLLLLLLYLSLFSSLHFLSSCLVPLWENNKAKCCFLVKEDFEQSDDHYREFHNEIEDEKMIVEIVTVQYDM